MYRHFEADLNELKQKILEMGGSVEKGLADVCQCLITRDPKSLQTVHQQELNVNRLQVAVDQDCVQLLAKQAPVAKDLRLVIAIIKINTDLERMGDQVVNIAHCVFDFFRSGAIEKFPANLITMSEKTRLMVRDSLDAFVRRDVELSHQILGRDDEIDMLKDNIINETMNAIRINSDHLESLLQVIMMAKNFERLADHATNIAEEVIYLATGDDVRHGGH